MIIYVDIDNTICNGITNLDYKTAVPIPEAIKKINSFYNAGHTIVYWTARGTESGIDWSEETTRQLNIWGASYHELKFGKPAFDMFIDDKAFNAQSLLNLYIND